jgi:predicted component of type VI protein secretion system
LLTDLPFEWFILILRILFIALLYFFVFQVIRVISREMRTVADPRAVASDWDDVSGALRVEDPGKTNLYSGQVFELEPVNVIGRDRRATIPVEHSFVSSEHSQISWEEGQWWASDLRSTNGTYVNGSRITVGTALQPGDEIQVGDVTFRLLR